VGGQGHRGHHPGVMRHRMPGSTGGHPDRAERTRGRTSCQVAGGSEERAGRSILRPHHRKPRKKGRKLYPHPPCRVRACDSSKCRSRWWPSDHPRRRIRIVERYPAPITERHLGMCPIPSLPNICGYLRLDLVRAGAAAGLGQRGRARRAGHSSACPGDLRAMSSSPPSRTLRLGSEAMRGCGVCPEHLGDGTLSEV
jgi:hypothetical protein